jgi:hypothetical protein
MRDIFSSTPLKLVLRSILVVSVSIFSLSIGSTHIVHAKTTADTNTCGQLLAKAEENFQATLAKDGSVPATPETKAAAQEYIRVSKLCYEELQARNTSAELMGDTPLFIDDGGQFFDNGPSAEFVYPNSKWGVNTTGTPGGTVTYSFMGNGISFSGESANYGNSVALTSLPGFLPCFVTDIQAAFAAWEAVANIQFVQVADSGLAFNAAGANGDIRIGTHYFDGSSGVLAHAYYPPPNGSSAAGDLHFDKSENWTCNNSGIDIGVVALHEIGHSLGLAHENTSTIAVMDPIYNPTLYGLQSDDINGAMTIYGATLAVPPANDEFANATIFNSVPYTDSVDTTGATENPNDPTVNVMCGDGFLRKGDKNVWYKYNAGSSNPVFIDTIGSDYDTYLAVWTGTALGSLALVGCNDDTESNLQSQLVLNPLAGTSYYIEVAGYSGRQTSADENNPGGNLKFHVNRTNTNVFIANNLKASYYIEPRGFKMPRYGTASGPMQVVSTNGSPIVTSQRAVYGNSFNELTGFPANQLTTDYWFPYYDDVNMATWLMIGNPDPSLSAHVEVYIGNGNTPYATYDIPHGQNVLPKYGITGGPVRVKSTNGVNIFTSQRAAYGASFNELMGFPAGQLTTDYWFTYYDDVSMATWLMIGNPDPSLSAHVEVYLGNGSSPIRTYDIPHGQSVLPRLGIAGGPLRVKSTNGVNIFTSQRAAYGASFNELMGFPAGQLTTDYWFPYYDDVNMATWLMIGNPDPSLSAHVEVYLGNGSSPIATYDIPHGQSVLPKLAISGGPVRVKSTNGVKVFTSERVAYGASFNELMGFPANQLTTSYWFTYYDDINMATWLMISVP